MREASAGQGVDRHLLGLREFIPKGETDAFFQDAGYVKGTAFGIASSNMSSGKGIHGGFGPPHIDGYGICYQIKDEKLKFSISVDCASKKTNIYKMTEEIERTVKNLLAFFPSRYVIQLVL